MDIRQLLEQDDLGPGDIVSPDEPGYEYPDAGGPDAPPEMQELVERFLEEVPLSVKKEQPLLYFALGTGTPAYKMSQDDAEYVDDAEDKGNHICQTCEYLYLKPASGKYICSQIRGEVSPEGWCKLWELADVLEDEE